MSEQTRRWTDDDYGGMLIASLIGFAVACFASPALCLAFGWLPVIGVPLNVSRAIILLAGLAGWCLLGAKWGWVGSFHISGQRGCTTGWIGGYVFPSLCVFSILFWWF